MSNLRNVSPETFGKVTLLCFTLFWFIPITWQGLTRTSPPFSPKWLKPLFGVSGMFEYGPAQWRVFFIEFRLENTLEPWSQVDEFTLFAGTPLGKRSRFQRIMAMIKAKGNENDTQELAAWISRKLSPSPSQPISIRIRQVAIPHRLFLEFDSLGALYREAMARNLRSLILCEYHPTASDPVSTGVKP